MRNLKIENNNLLKEEKKINKNIIDGNKNKQDIKKSLKELKETTIHLKQKLDTITSERNVMDVEFSQVLLLRGYCINKKNNIC